ncbi:MAG: hypothetical protein ABW116_14245 [Candidatus Sedimenticola sp. 20ELBAFRAG]
MRLTRPLITGLTILCITLTGTASTSQAGDVLGAVFSEMEKQAIEDYYKGRYGRSIDREESGKRAKKHKSKGKGKSKKKKGLPPGLAKRETLPPGLAKQLKEKGRLPPGLEKRDLPEGLDRMLPETLPGQKRVIIDNDVMLIEEATGLILDILKDVF